MNRKVCGALGLAQKAGKCKSGEFAVSQAMSAGKVALVVLDPEASEATRDRYRIDCEKHGIEYLEIAGAGEAIGKPERKVLGITDLNFVNLILEASKE